MRFVCFLFLVACLICQTSMICFGQQAERIIKRTVWKNEPVRITSIKAKGQAVNVDKKFFEDDEWLRDFKVEVVNVSNKDIIFLEVSIIFPQDENGLPEHPANEVLSYGVYPSDPSKLDNSTSLRPGDNATLTIDRYESLQSLLQFAGHPKSIRGITLRLGRVIFSDGTMWSVGKTLTRDPFEPNRWIAKPLPVSFFWNPSYQVPGYPSQASKLLKTFGPRGPELSSADDENCHDFMGENPKQCNNYACHTQNPEEVPDILPAPPLSGYLFRDETLRCNRDDNGQDCFAFGTAKRDLV